MTSARKRSSQLVVLSALLGLLLVAGAPAFSVLLWKERQTQIDANARVQRAIDMMHSFGEKGDPPSDYFLDVLYLVDRDAVSAETMNRIADMLGDRTYKEYAAKALELFGPRATLADRVVPALRRAIAEELAIWKGRRNLIIGAGPTTLDAELRALGEITGVPVEQLLQHPEQFEKLPPDMAACMEMFNAEECDKLLAEWRSNPY
jgi:hypothetical protein